jgi:4-hydroxybenzoate polyprenyltransferase
MEQLSRTSSVDTSIESSDGQRPLCVDLDGTLVPVDMLWEGVLRLVRRRPSLLLKLPLWMLRGRAHLEQVVAERAEFDPTSLPYRADVLDIARAGADGGRRIVLTTLTGGRMAQAVADHLTVFHEVLAGGGPTRDAAASKRDLLESRFGRAGFDYVGASVSDLPALASARRGYLVGASGAAASAASGLGAKIEVVSTRKSRLRAALRVMRPHQWAKNALVVVPVLLALSRPTVQQIVAAGVAAAAFCLCASAGYVFNDLLDVDADRAHRTKRRRPFASGDLPLVYGPPLFLALFLGSFGLAAAMLPLSFVGMLALYFVATLAYSFYFKSQLLVDVVVLAWLYTHRVLAGGIATGIPISTWLLAFSMFMFFSLAFAKRYIELRQSMAKGGKLGSRGYHTQDLEMVASIGPTSGYIAVLVFCLYVDSKTVTEHYHTPMLLWFIAPVFMFWISRVWFLAHRGQMQDDPVKFALTDRVSWLCGLTIAAVAAVARIWPL